MMPGGQSNNTNQNGNIEVDGVVTENLPNTQFRVKINDGQERLVLCTLSGKMRINYIKIMPGDRVRVEITPYDLERGRITFRYR